MKKIIALILAALMLVFCVACGNTNDDVKDTDVTTDEITTEAGVVEPAKPATEVFNAALDAFYAKLAPLFEMDAADVASAFMGGYFSDSEEPTYLQGAAAKTPVDVEDATAMLAANSFVTEDVLAKIDDAAIFGHAMNVPTLTMSIVHVVNASDVDAIASTMRDNIGGNEVWMCGFPEKYIVIKLDDYVISGYGKVDMIDNLKAAFTETYENAVVVCDEVIE